jgi:rhodanese-related sulfurtransferase
MGILLVMLATAALGVAVTPQPVQAQDTPPSLAGARTVTAEDVTSLIAQGATVFDLRKKASYAEKHIPGAKPARYDEKSVKAASFDATADTFDLGQLPPDKNAKLIFHGHGADGWKGYKASAAAVRAGYKNVYFFRGGFAEWIAKGLPTQ